MSDRKRQKMTDDEVKEIVKRKLEGNLPFHTGALQSDRTKALQYYRGEAVGILQKIEGKSGVISRDVSEVVDALMPSLMRVFASGDQTVVFEPTGQEDEAGAEQATDYANLVWSKDNPGFQILHTWVKDGLLQRNGTVKIWWDTKERQVKETYGGLDQEELAALMGELEQDKSVTVVGTVPGPAGFDVTIRRSTKRGKITIKNVPPEEMISDLDYPSLDADCPFCAHRYRSTISDLRAEGYDEKLLKDIPTQDSNTADATTERAERLKPEYSGVDASDPASDAMRQCWVAECYIRMDCDGDGYAELRQIIVAGDTADVILSNEEVDDNPFADWTPNPMPHKRYGESLADKSIDIQEAKTALWRQAMDNLYRVNMPRTEIVEGQVDMEDALSQQTGGVVKVKAPGMMREVAIPPMFQHAFTGLEYLDTVREKRTGVTAYNQGLDANSLNKTATGINAIMGAAHGREELIARIFAETGMVRAFKVILKLTKQHQDKPRTVRLRNQWVQVDPRTWNDDMDATVMVGLGTGNKDQQLMHASNLMNIQKEIITLQGGVEGPLVNAENVYNAAEVYVKASDLKKTERFFMDPKAPPDPNKPPVQPKPDPAMVEAQAKAQLAQQDAETKRQISAADAQHQAQLKEQQAQQDGLLKQRQADQDFANTQRSHEQQMAMDREKAMVARTMEVERAQHQAGLVEQEAQSKSQMAKREQSETLRLKAREQGFEDKLQSYIAGTEEPEEPEEDMDAKVAEGMTSLAEAIRAQADTVAQGQSQVAQVLAQLAQGQAAIGDGMRAMAEQMGKRRMIIRGDDGKAVGVEAV